jgi:hypothetical protein
MPCFVVIVVFMSQRATKNTILTRLSKTILVGSRKSRKRMVFGEPLRDARGGQVQRRIEL